MPANKEPNYFCSDLPADLRVGTLAEYEALFSTAPPHALTGEASVFYLYSKVAIGQIMAHNVKAKIIIVLRNPIEATRSMHAFRWNNHLEDVGDFEQAWSGSPWLREQGRRCSCNRFPVQVPVSRNLLGARRGV